MKFTSFKTWLFERKNDNLEYDCLMLGADIPNWNEKISIVDKDDVYETEDDYGYEKSPHVTIIYGIHPNEVDKEELYKEIKKLKPIKATIEKISFFECDDYDVVKFDVPVTPELKEYRKTFMKFPNTQDYDDYKPHMTISYVKKGKAKKYAQKLEKSFKVTFNKGIYSSPGCNKKYFDLKSQ
jgi:2'-5' RNA ligase